MRIGDLAARAGVSAATIRYYERQGLLPAPPRRGGKRSYAPDDLMRLLALRAGRRAGLRIAELRALAALADGASLARALRAAVRRADADLARRTHQRDWLEAAAACAC